MLKEASQSELQLCFSAKMEVKPLADLTHISVAVTF